GRSSPAPPRSGAPPGSPAVPAFAAAAPDSAPAVPASASAVRRGRTRRVDGAASASAGGAGRSWVSSSGPALLPPGRAADDPPAGSVRAAFTVSGAGGSDRAPAAADPSAAAGSAVGPGAGTGVGAGPAPGAPVEAALRAAPSAAVPDLDAGEGETW